MSSSSGSDNVMRIDLHAFDHFGQGSADLWLRGPELVFSHGTHVGRYILGRDLRHKLASVLELFELNLIRGVVQFDVTDHSSLRFERTRDRLRIEAIFEDAPLRAILTMQETDDLRAALTDR